MRTMYDGVTASKLPTTAEVVAGYVDGLYKWSAADWARFPNSVKIQIAVLATTVADVLDVETGNDMNPSDWVSWVQLCRAHGRNPTIYMNGSTWPSVRNAFTSRNVAEPMYWVAQYDGVATVPAGAVGKQYSSNASYDLSVVVDGWPSSSPAPSVSSEDDMLHLDLELDKTVVLTNPAAVKGGNGALCLTCDFGNAVVRVATFSLKANGWTVLPTVDLVSTGGAWRKDLPPDTNKVSISLQSTSVPGMPVAVDLILF